MEFTKGPCYTLHSRSKTPTVLDGTKEAFTLDRQRETRKKTRLQVGKSVPGPDSSEGRRGSPGASGTQLPPLVCSELGLPSQGVVIMGSLGMAGDLRQQEGSRVGHPICCSRKA